MTHEGSRLLIASSEVRRYRGRAWPVALLIGIVGAGISFALGWILTAQELSITQERFHSDAGRRVAGVTRDYRGRMGVVRTLAAFFAGSRSVGDDEFRTFTSPSLQTHTSVVMAWAPRINDGSGGSRYPLEFAETSQDTNDLAGFDVSSIPTCRVAIEHAVQTGKGTVAVGPWPKRDGDNRLLMYTFERATNIPSAAEQGAGEATDGHVDGVVMVATQIGMLTESTLKVFVPLGIDFYITTREDSPIYLRPAPIPGDHATFVPGQPAPTVDGIRPLVVDIEVADSQWKAVCIPMPSYLAAQRTWVPHATVLAGLTITALAVGYTILLMGRTIRVERLVAQRTRELAESEHRFRRLIENASDAFFLRDRNGKILDVNKAACDSLGYTREDLLSMNVGEFDPRFHENTRLYTDLPADRYPVTFESVQRRKDGAIVPVEIRLAALDTEEERLMLALVRDITDRKHAEAELHEEQRRLRDMLDLHERDRRLVAYEIHDGLAQQLAAAVYRFQSVPRLLDGDPRAVQQMFDSAMEFLREAMAETRRLISGLRPPVLDECGVVAAIECLVSEQQEEDGPEIEFVHEAQTERMPAPLESAVFRIVQECLTNARRYSGSKKVRVTLAWGDGRVHIEVQDWGVGFNPAEVQGDHFGLQGIRERARLLDGIATIETAPNRGARIVVEFPLTPREEIAPQPA